MSDLVKESNYIERQKYLDSLPQSVDEFFSRYQNKAIMSGYNRMLKAGLYFYSDLELLRVIREVYNNEAIRTPDWWDNEPRYNVFINKDKKLYIKKTRVPSFLHFKEKDTAELFIKNFEDLTISVFEYLSC